MASSSAVLYVALALYLLGLAIIAPWLLRVVHRSGHGYLRAYLGLVLWPLVLVWHCVAWAWERWKR